MESVPSQFDSLAVGVIIHDPETGEIRYANEFAEDLYGYSEAELRTMEVGEFSSDSFTQAEAIQRIQAAAAGQSQQFEWRLRRPTGELYWIEVRLSEMLIDGESYVVALVRDISEYKLNLRHLRVLTRITRHNLRNKLNVIDGFFRKLEADDGSEHGKTLDRIRRNIAELLNLTSWIDTVKSTTSDPATTETYDLCQLVTEIGDTYRHEYPDITWEIDCEQTYVTGGPTLRDAVEELIDNAVTHNPHEDLTITVSVSEQPAHEQACLRIADTGRPIPDLEIEPLVGGYEPDPLAHGEGIGLWEVQTIINAHGGRLSIEENSVDRKVIEVALPRATPVDPA